MTAIGGRRIWASVVLAMLTAGCGAPEPSTPAGAVSGSAPGPETTSGATSKDPRAAGGRRVGLHGVAVSVPRAWSSHDVSCNTPIRDTFYVAVPADCEAGASPRVSSVAMSRRPLGAGARGLRPVGEVDGRQVVAGGISCRASFPGICEQSFGVPSLEAFFRVHVEPDDGGGAGLRRIRRSLEILGPDETAVPSVPLRGRRAVTRALEDAGLGVEVDRTTCPPNASCFGGVTGTDPAAGVVVPVGSVVTVMVLRQG